MAKNKVEFGISQLHVGTYTVAAGGAVTLGTPYHQEGAVSFSPEESSERNVFHADNIEYWVDYSGGTIEGDLTVAKFDDEFKTQFLGYRTLTNGRRRCRSSQGHPVQLLPRCYHQSIQHNQREQDPGHRSTRSHRCGRQRHRRDNGCTQARRHRLRKPVLCPGGSRVRALKAQQRGREGDFSASFFYRGERHGKNH